MYIHRIAIDANRINAGCGISAMNALERFHDAQLIEIVKTSTFATDLKGERRLEKAAKYRTIGSDGVFYVADGPSADAVPGATGTDSRMAEILRIIFPHHGKNLNQKKPENDRRDALHVDQAMQNEVDWFVTEEKKIRKAQPKLFAAGIDLRIGDAPEVLASIEDYFQSRYETLDVAVLRTELMRDFHSHPVILGSNRVGIWELTDPTSGEPVFFTRVIGNRLGVGTVLRDSNGGRLVTIDPGKTPVFDRPGPSVRMMVGESHLLVGDKSCMGFAVSFQGRTILEGRIARSGHIVISRGVFRSSTGTTLATINRESLTLGG
jgi:hypothetical protein